jgi:SH3 domain-containing protein
MKIYFLFSLLLGIITSSACASSATTVATVTATISSRPTKQILPTIPSKSTPEPYVIVDVMMNVRNGPGTEFDVIGQIESQKKYLVIGKHVDWWFVNLGNNQSGWVYAPGNVTRFFGNADNVPDIASPPTPTPEIISACTPADKTETQSEGLKKARNAFTTFFELLNQREYEQAAALYGGDYQGLRDSNPLLDPQDHGALLTNGCEINGLQCLRVKRIVDERAVSSEEYHFTVEFLNPDGSLFVRGPCCGGNATDFPPESQFAYTVIRNCAGEFLVLELPVYVP